jgi:hypothetical protein
MMMTMTKWEPSLLTNIELLSAEECSRVREGLDSLRDLWIQRHPVVPFYTLGASNYFDIAFNPKLPYYVMARETNPVLMREFGWLYESLASSLQGMFGLPVEYPAKLALPGFHIFLAHEALKDPKALMHGEWFQKRDDPNVMSSPIHCDTPQYVVNWSGIKDVSMAQPLSVTLAIGLPESGAGMYVWDVYMQDTANTPEPEVHALLQKSKRWLHEYNLGQYCLHSGLRYHQIAPFRDVQPNDVRITLQGHGLIGLNSIKLYW